MTQTFSQQALNYYFHECLTIAENRKNRKTTALNSFMEGLTLPNKFFEKTLRKTLKDRGDQISLSLRNLIESKLQNNDFVPENSIDEQNALLAIDRLSKFVWPSPVEQSLQAQEEIDLNQFINNNPRNEPSTITREDLTRFRQLRF